MQIKVKPIEKTKKKAKKTKQKTIKVSTNATKLWRNIEIDNTYTFAKYFTQTTYQTLTTISISIQNK